MKKKLLVAGMLLVSLGITSNAGISYATEETPSVYYQTHIQKKGWEKEYKKDGASSGSTGEGLRLEGIRIYTDQPNLSIKYAVHVQSIGWMSEVTNKEMAGTTGKGKRLEAIRMHLEGSEAEKYDIYYRVHSQKFGWLDWAKNGEDAGTQGYGYRLEAIQVQLVAKDAGAPGAINRPFRRKPTGVSYTTYVQTKKWQKRALDGETSGSANQSLRLEALKLNLTSKTTSGSIQYRGYFQNTGWSSYVNEGVTLGQANSQRRMEALQIRLTGNLAEVYSVYYRTKIKGNGWLNWTSDDGKSGSNGMKKQIEAVQIKLIAKEDAAPSSTGALTFLGEVELPASYNPVTEQYKATFVNSLGKHAMQVAEKNRLYASVMIAQGMLESAYGTSQLGQAPNYNLFGVKGDYQGEYVLFNTQEYDKENKEWITVKAKFRKYPSHRQSLEDYADKMRNGLTTVPDNYCGTWRENASNYKEAVRGLVSGKYAYATDPNYVDKVINLIETWKLYQFDY